MPSFAPVLPLLIVFKATSRCAVVSLLRFLYTGTYLADHHESPTFLPHVEAFKIARDLDVPELQLQAHVNLTQETKDASSRATPPSDICSAIQFMYRHIVGTPSIEYQSLLDTLLNYCVSVFVHQSLGAHKDFRQTVFEMPAFHRDLCRTNLKRGFDADGASEIMQLPVCRPTPHSQAHLFKHTLADFQYEIWQVGEAALDSNHLEATSDPIRKRKPSCGNFTLVHRPRDDHSEPTYFSSESEADSSGDDYKVVYRPKTRRPTNPLACESEPECSCDDQGYHTIHLSDSDYQSESEVGPSSISCHTPSMAPTTCLRPCITAGLVLKDESDGAISDNEWNLV